MANTPDRPRSGGLHTRTQAIPKVLLPDGRIPSFGGRRHHIPDLPPGQWTSKHRAVFHRRLRAVWDWFRLSVTGLMFAFMILAGGIGMAKLLIILWMELLSEYFAR